MSDISHWTGPGRAPNFDRKVAETIAAAESSIKAFENAAMEAMKRGYPLGHRVEVIHYRGRFFGHVVGWDKSGWCVAVMNERTRKVSKWWAAHVQLCEAEESGV